MTSNTLETQSNYHLSTNRVKRVQLDNIREFERTTNQTPEGRTITYKYSLTEIERTINHIPGGRDLKESTHSHKRLMNFHTDAMHP